MSNEEQIINFTLNKPQARALTVMANEMWLLWGRGTGKTQGAISPWILHKTEVMPRSNGGLIGKTFKDLEKKILQPIFLAWQQQGIKKDVSYVYGKRPPEHWKQPLTPIIDYSTVVTFCNGTTMELISLHDKGSANGKSLQWVVGDEAKLLNDNRLREEVFPILRGHVQHFGHSAWYGAKLFVTDKFSPNISWILDKKKLHNEKIVNAVIFYQLQFNQLRFELANAGTVKAYKIRQKLRKLDIILTALRKNLVYYGEAKAIDNIKNLSADYFENMRRSLTAYEYSIAIDNQDPIRADKGFYPDRTAAHLYNNDFDDDVSQPLGVVLDYQASLSPLVSFQVNDLVVPGMLTLNFLHSLYVKQPAGIRDVIKEFCSMHIHRPVKHVYYFYDHTAVADQNDSDSYCNKVQKYFRENGWQVTPIYEGAAPGHNVKYNTFKDQFQEKDDNAYPIRFNEENCASLLLSMDLAATKPSLGKGTEKDKSNERDKDYPQEKATHLSDCFDMAVWGVNVLKYYPVGSDIPARVGIM